MSFCCLKFLNVHIWLRNKFIIMTFNSFFVNWPSPTFQTPFTPAFHHTSHINCIRAKSEQAVLFPSSMPLSLLFLLTWMFFPHIVELVILLTSVFVSFNSYSRFCLNIHTSLILCFELGAALANQCYFTL